MVGLGTFLRAGASAVHGDVEQLTRPVDAQSPDVAGCGSGGSGGGTLAGSAATGFGSYVVVTLPGWGCRRTHPPECMVGTAHNGASGGAGVARTVWGMSSVIAANDVRHGPLSGPWLRGFWVELPFVARSKSNYRQGDAGWGSLASFEDAIAAIVAQHVPAGWELGSSLERVADRPVVVALVAARSVLDAANLSKSVLDALQGVCYVSDAQVAGSVNVGERGRLGQWLSIALAQLSPGAPLDAVVAATSELPARWLEARAAPVA